MLSWTLLFACQKTLAQCDPGDTLIGEDDVKYYCLRTSKYVDSPIQQLGSNFCHAHLQVTADQDALKALGLKMTTSVNDFELYEQVSQQQKDDLVRKIYSQLLDYGLKTTVVLVGQAKSLNPVNVNKAANWLNERHFGDGVMVKSLRWVARQKDKPAMFKAYSDFVDKVEQARSNWELARDVSEDPENSCLILMAGALKIVVSGDDVAAVAITAGELAPNMVYLCFLTGQVDDLTHAVDADAERVRLLSERLRKHVKELLDAKRAWQAEASNALGAPVGPNALPECK